MALNRLVGTVAGNSPVNIYLPTYLTGDSKLKCAQGHKTDRDTLGGRCLTPNCWGSVLELAWHHLATGQPTGKKLTHKEKKDPASANKNPTAHGGGGGGGKKKKKQQQRRSRALMALARSSSGKW